MHWEIRPDRPVYLQLVEQMELAVATGEWAPGARIAPVRELAVQAGVNPNTMQRALPTLDLRGLVASQRTAGRTVTADAHSVRRLRAQLAQTRAREFCRALAQLGLSAADARGLVELCETEGIFDGTSGSGL